jgi:RNA polymerase sigma-70 factor (ECF subfamily)
MEEALQNILIEDNSTNLEIEYNNLLETANILIDKLPARQKDIFLLSINGQLTSEQIAQQLNISKKTVENYLTMAKASLRKSFSDGSILPLLFFWLFLK